MVQNLNCGITVGITMSQCCPLCREPDSRSLPSTAATITAVEKQSPWSYDESVQVSDKNWQAAAICSWLWSTTPQLNRQAAGLFLSSRIHSGQCEDCCGGLERFRLGKKKGLFSKLLRLLPFCNKLPNLTKKTSLKNECSW